MGKKTKKRRRKKAMSKAHWDALFHVLGGLVGIFLVGLSVYVAAPLEDEPRCALCNQTGVKLDTRSNCAKCAEISIMEAL